MSKRSRRSKQGKRRSALRDPRWSVRRRLLLAALGLAGVLLAFTRFESYESLYDAEYVGSQACGECHTIVYERWRDSPHARMVQAAAPASVVGNFSDGSWTPPPEARLHPDEGQPVARMYQENGAYFMALRHPETRELVPFEIEYVVGYQYRQVYLTREAGGVLRRLPLQWSTEREDFFPYWNYQEGSLPTLPDLWAQMTTLNSAWNLFCARCHTTHLVIRDKDEFHQRADVEWTDLGIACEACHGPGSQHVNYFAHNYVNRLAAFANSRLRGEPVAYVANAPRLTPGQDFSVCARCHGADILYGNQDIYRVYEPGYSREGRINDISDFFTHVPLEPGRTVPTVEVWPDGSPKGIGMLFRSFVESGHYEKTAMRCYDCHDAHDNKVAAGPGLLAPSDGSNRYCLSCHTELRGEEERHSFHEAGSPGAYCYDCHAPHRLQNIVTGVESYTRTHDFSSIPDPAASVRYGLANSPNACNECHADQPAEWALEQMREWWGDGD